MHKQALYWFYLNIVGFKGAIAGKLHTLWQAFYLNIVGFKERIAGGSGPIATAFYLNIVGFKDYKNKIFH